MTDPRDPMDLESRLRALTPRRPSPELRARVLRQAAAGLARPITPWQRLWTSWTFRWGWAVALAAAVVIGTVSERSFRGARWGERAIGTASSGPATASDVDRRNAELEAVLRIESEVDPPDAAVFGWGDANRSDPYRALALTAGEDAVPRRDPGPPRDTRRPRSEAVRRHS